MPDTSPDLTMLTMEKGDYRRLGAQIQDGGVNFSIFSAHADRVELCIFNASGDHEVARMDLPEFTNEVWHGFVPNLPPGSLYGYRVHGPFQPEQGHRFNPAKLLLDPYARALVGDVRWNDAHYAYKIGDEAADLSFSDLDSAAFMPKCQVIGDDLDWTDDKRPDVSWDKTIFYETHVRGFTKLHPAVPENQRGTFAGMAAPQVIDHLKRVGVTSIELLPIHAFVDDHYLQPKNLVNYWGYNSIGFFAPQARYLGASGLAGWRDMIRAFHDAGLEVILDVVYNHTAEGNELGATLSFKGIDNASYYRLMPDNPRYYINDTGTGNTINTTHPRVLQMVLDSLRFWVETMHVDGFRFDLGTILAREVDGFDQRSGFFYAIGQDPILSHVKLIGEPWDIGPGGYQVGGFPPGWAEWNDQYRDTVRSYWKGDQGIMRDFAARVTGSGDIYDLRGRQPWAGVNFIAAHDGFTLNDLVSYNEKHNEANGEDNNDGHNDNRSYNYGVEGPTDDPALIDLRERQKRNLLATLLLSHGTPMILAGDEFGHTQDGNNNAYCQDNKLNWIDWEKITPKDQALTDFVSRLTQMRRDQPLFRRANFRDGLVIEWLNASGGNQNDEQWDDDLARCIGLRLLSPASETEPEQELLILFNAYDGSVAFTLPERGDGAWSMILDTNDPNGAPHDSAGEIELPPRSYVVLEARRQEAGS
jgi:glycogen operon protein